MSDLNANDTQDDLPERPVDDDQMASDASNDERGTGCDLPDAEPIARQEDSEQQLANRLGGTLDLPPIPSADTFAREQIGGDIEPDLPVVGEGEVDETPELPTRETDTRSSRSR